MVVHQSSNQSVFFQLAFVPCHPLNQLLESVALVLSYARVACSRCGRALSLWQFNDAASNRREWFSLPTFGASPSCVSPVP